MFLSVPLEVLLGRGGSPFADAVIILVSPQETSILPLDDLAGIIIHCSQNGAVRPNTEKIFFVPHILYTTAATFKTNDIDLDIALRIVPLPQVFVYTV